ncbi:hypothetical protein B0H14DRAFT_2724765 [Mycena olivaceomarginata]|nr:hypothetical protein B0H14DRAFT_2724765 [Mycena olivaceomarginata]
MGRLPLFDKTVLIHLLILLFYFIVIYGVCYTPTFLQSYPPTAAFGDALANYYAWMRERNNLLRGLTSHSLLGIVFFLCLFARGVYVARKTTRASPDGTAPASRSDTHPTALEAQVALPTAPTPVPNAGLFVLGVVRIVLDVSVFIWSVAEAGVFSLQRPLLDNIRVAVQHTVGGFKVIFGPAMLLAFLGCVERAMRGQAAKERAAKAAKAESVAVMPEGEKPYTDEEKV